MKPTDRAAFGAGTLGFAFGGLFDGILLHQVLQWHHFVSLVPVDGAADLRTQVLWDGLFHIATLAIGAFGVWRLWASRARLTGVETGRRLAVAALLGFAIWQAVDVVLFHWVLSFHRVRVDVPDPLAWDLGWLAVVGGLPLAAALLLRARDATPPGGAVAACLALMFLVAAPAAALPPRDPGPTVVLFRPGTAFATTLAAGATPVWVDAADGIAAVVPGPGGTAALYAAGAWLVGGGVAGGTCLAWLR